MYVNNLKRSKEEVTLTKSEKYEIREESNTHSLTVKQVNEADSGKYSVSAANDYGKSTYSAILQVQG